MLIMWLPILAIFVVLAAVTWLARKRWPVITVLLYALWVTAVFTPVVLCVVFWLSDPEVLDLEEVYDSILSCCNHLDLAKFTYKTASDFTGFGKVVSFFLSPRILPVVTVLPEPGSNHSKLYSLGLSFSLIGLPAVG